MKLNVAMQEMAILIRIWVVQNGNLEPSYR